MLNPAAAARRALPAVDRLLKLRPVEELAVRYGRTLVTATVREVLDSHRRRLADDAAAQFDEAAFVAECASSVEKRMRPSLRAVCNLSGTVLHTNLGRAVMPESAARAVAEAMTRPVNLEFDLDGGSRGERDSHVEGWLKRLTGAEAAVVVNNNAAAVYLALNTLALRREVLVSRGELIEIGGAFRMPDIMARAGCKLKEVGTTNRTHLKDYAEAITAQTAAIMKVHTSNYAIQGFTSAVAESDLASLAHEHGLPFIVDLGSGMLVDLEDYGLPHEPTPREAFAHGADLVTFSGDKLLGGPQAGLLVGTKALVGRIRKNPMKRALRVDKMTLAALEAVLRLYSDPDRLAQELPGLRSLTRKHAEIEAQANRVLPHVVAALAGSAEAQVISCSSQIGSGSLPVDSLPSAGIAVSGGGKRRGSFAERIATAFRSLPVPVIGHIKDGAFVMDLRCLDDETGFIEQLRQLKI
ncbi:MAG: L-seryl-tRNA(Sec) selenium transferase [Betaproteobacteria bacterium RIFCSPLOWO2_02_64_14]|nr:MAG: L-seryl-tRNA(Sec) selenium transferase [Betaproteobacteria bacterium RIFCSPLOWO2_02_64_14]